MSAIQIAQDAVNLNAPSIGVSALPGSITVTRTVTNVAATATTWRSSVKAPAGYRVTVSPSTLTIAPGASASFTVSFVNDGTGQVGQWTTGSLSWTNGYDYKVRSAIAVRGSTFGAPASVAGTGTDGSLPSFSSQFGYTGPYSVTAHGLVPAKSLSETISKGEVVKFPFDAQDVGYARWSLKLPNGDLHPGDDLDMVLLDGTGKLVALSGNPGTDEQIDINGLPDGSYILEVLGASVAVPDSAFTVSQWLVPAAPLDKPNLTVSAPDSGTLGTSADVTVAWDHLDPGTEYLGTITHADKSTTLATTVVDITT